MMKSKVKNIMMTYGKDAKKLFDNNNAIKEPVLDKNALTVLDQDETEAIIERNRMDVEKILDEDNK